MKNILKMALITMGTMTAANYLASVNATARKYLKGSVVSAVTNTNQSAAGSSWWSI